MRKLLFVLFMAFAILAILNCSADDGMPCAACKEPYPSQPSPYCNANDYGTVEIGNQTWMANNWSCNVPGSICYDYDPANCANYGRLYYWVTAMNLPDSCGRSTCATQVQSKHQGICPSGWHIPNNDEWSELVNYVESDQKCSDCAGKHLKASSGWEFNDYEGKSGNGEDTYGFAALPGGGSSSTVFGFGLVGYYGNWWSSSEINADSAYARFMSFNDESVPWWYSGGKYGSLYSVRCVKD